MEKRTENQAKEIKLITASYTGEYEILTVVPKLGATTFKLWKERI